MTKQTIYILELEDNKYYVGKSKCSKKRILQHFNDNGSEWTKLHKPIKILEQFKGDSWDEEKHTLITMDKYGIDNVRGGSYCKIILTESEKEKAIQTIASVMDKCYKCGETGHFANECLIGKNEGKEELINEDFKDENEEYDECCYCQSCEKRFKRCICIKCNLCNFEYPRDKPESHICMKFCEWCSTSHEMNKFNCHNCRLFLSEYENMNQFFSKLITYIGITNFKKCIIEEEEIYAINIDYNEIINNEIQIFNISPSLSLDGILIIYCNENLCKILELSNIEIVQNDKNYPFMKHKFNNDEILLLLKYVDKIKFGLSGNNDYDDRLINII